MGVDKPGAMPYVCPMNIHAHVETYSTDCDGPIVYDYVITPNEEEIAEHEAKNGVNDFSDIQFHHRVVAHVVNTYSLYSQGTLTVNKLEDGSVRLSWTEQTDEGSRNVEATICEDEGCDTGVTRYRDIRAEEAGY